MIVKRLLLCERHTPPVKSSDLSLIGLDVHLPHLRATSIVRSLILFGCDMGHRGRCSGSPQGSRRTAFVFFCARMCELFLPLAGA